MRFIKPLDEETIQTLAQDGEMGFVTLEEGVLAGGFGSAVLEYLSNEGFSNRVQRVGLPDEFIEHGSVAKQYAEAGLDVDGIVDTIRSLLPAPARRRRARDELAH